MTRIRGIFGLAVALVMVNAPVWADSIDDAEAKRRGITVEQLQVERELAKAKARIAELEKELAATKQPKPTAPVVAVGGKSFSLADALKTMPVELRPKPGEAASAADARLEWLKKNLQNRRIHITFKVVLRDAPLLDTRVTLNNGPTDALDFLVSCEFASEQLMGRRVEVGEVITVEGDILGVEISPHFFVGEKATVVLNNCSLAPKAH